MPARDAAANEQIIERVEASIAHFFDAMKCREDLSIKIGRRTTQIIRFSIIGMFLLGLALFWLLSSLTTNLKTMTNQMVEMSMIMQRMDQNMSTLPAMHHEVRGINQRMTIIRDNMELISGSMGSLDDNMAVMPSLQNEIALIEHHVSNINQRMDQQLATLNFSMGHMNNTMSRINYDVKRISRPMKMFPFD